MPLLSLIARPAFTIAGALALAAIVALAAQLAFEHGVVVAVVGPLVALALGTLGTVLVGYALEARRRRQAAAYGRTLEREVAQRTLELRQTQLEVLERLSLAAEQRDSDTGEHLRRMSRLCGRLARAVGLGEAEAERIEQASLLHDVGKIGVPDEILHKPGALTPEEQAAMRRHTTIGAELLAGSSSPLLRVAESIARTHHEHWDGTGYPFGLAGEEIPLRGPDRLDLRRLRRADDRAALQGGLDGRGGARPHRRRTGHALRPRPRAHVSSRSSAANDRVPASWRMRPRSGVRAALQSSGAGVDAGLVTKSIRLIATVLAVMTFGPTAVAHRGRPRRATTDACEPRHRQRGPRLNGYVDAERRGHDRLLRVRRRRRATA